MDRRTAVKIHWVPGHMNVKENKKADEAAKEAAVRPVTRRCTQSFASLTHVGHTVTERKWKKAKN